MSAQSPQEWFESLPKVTKTYLVAAVACTTLVSFNAVSPYSLLFDPWLVLSKFQIYRLFTPLTFLGGFGLGFVFQLFFFVRYSSALEESPFVPGGPRVGTTADYCTMVLFGQVVLLTIGYVMGMPLLSFSFVFMVIYLWSRRFPDVPINFWGFRSQGIYLPWILLVFSILLGQSVVNDLVGIAAGHLYYFLVEIVPTQYNKHVLFTPQWLRKLVDGEHAYYAAPTGGVRGGYQAPPRAGGYNWGSGGRRLGD
mmetsp:Transcript_4188/g.13499  ORF Transcript_4188/g.13499 Transcript_4188/m.13499 type:complete len:252 (-) Transcript_4188:56-811(-)